jgi:antitoxin Phd
MPKTWALQDAKNKFSEVVECALNEGAQHITRRGKDTAVLLSVKDYERLKGRKGSLVDFLHAAPLKSLDLERAKDLPRDVEL